VQVVTGAPAATTGGPNNPAGTLTEVSSAACPPATVLLGGGATVTNVSQGRGAVFMSRPLNGTSTTTWTAQAIVVVAENGMNHITVTAYALCTT
jgi:hypothetical protein